MLCKLFYQTSDKTKMWNTSRSKSLLSRSSFLLKREDQLACSHYPQQKKRLISHYFEGLLEKVHAQLTTVVSAPTLAKIEPLTSVIELSRCSSYPMRPDSCHICKWLVAGRGEDLQPMGTSRTIFDHRSDSTRI